MMHRQAGEAEFGMDATGVLAVRCMGKELERCKHTASGALALHGILIKTCSDGPESRRVLRGC